ncbi:MAG: helix-turn-helix domain-containing protein [Micropepsaceae bacterium]
MSAPAKTPAQAPARRPRADAVRNREALIDAAKAAFSQSGPDVSLEEIARRADVGIGTLYRHFPTRDAVIEAVYRREVDQLGDAATALLKSHAPLDAMRRWLALSIDYLDTKKLIAPALGTLTGGGGAALMAHSGSRLVGAVTELLKAAQKAGAVRADVRANDLVQGFAGIAYNTAAPGWRASAERLVDIIIAGIRT